MADFHLWARIEHLGPSEFLVIVTAVSADGTDARPITKVKKSRVAAEEIKRAMLIELGAEITARGDRVVDVEADG